LDKVIRDGKVAVLYSPGFGAGWFTWHHIEELVYDPRVVHYVETGEKELITSYVEELYPDVYCGGVDDLAIEWIKEGTLFRINEYDGNESIETKEEVDWLVA
jgi:hypothetical protein